MPALARLHRCPRHLRGARDMINLADNSIAARRSKPRGLRTASSRLRADEPHHSVVCHA